MFSIPLDSNRQKILERIVESQLPINSKDINLNNAVFFLLKESRLDMDQDKFTEYSEILKDRTLSKEEKHFLQYEIILNLQLLNKINDVASELDSWLLDDNDYEWKIKKAILYSNINQLQVAVNLLGLSLEKIKKLLTIENENYKLLSLESIILHNLERIRKDRGFFSKRLRELSYHNCDSNSELEQTWLSVTEYIYDLGNKVSIGFDPRTKNSRSKLGDFMSQEMIDSYAALVLQEKFGLYFIRSRLDIAHKNISLTLPNFSLVNQIYYANKNIIDEIFTRQFVFYLQATQLDILKTILSNSILNNSPLVPFEHAIEILSRVYFSFSPEVQNFFDNMILEIIGSKENYNHSENTLFSNLLNRIIFSKRAQQKNVFIEQLLVVLDNHLIENSSNNIFDPFLVLFSHKDISQIKLEINEKIITNLFKNISSECVLIRLVFLYKTDNLTLEQEFKLALEIESLQRNRSLGMSNFLFQSTFDFIVDSIYLKERSPFQTIQNFVTNKEIPNISNNGVYHDGTAFDNYFSEFSLIIDETKKIHKEIPREIFVEWLNKFFLWWETEKESFFKEDTEKIWLFRLPDYLLKLTYHLNNTILRNIPISSFDPSLKENLSLLVNDIYHKKLHCFVYFFPQAKRLNLNLDHTKDYTDLIWRFTDDNIKHAIGSLYHYLGLIAESEIKEDPAPLIDQLFAILKYGSHHNKLFACDTIHRTLKMYPKLFQKENCDFLIEFSINYYDMIIDNSELIMSQDDFELQASISTLVTQLRINKTEHVGNKLDLWIEFIEKNILPEIRMNSDSFTL